MACRNYTQCTPPQCRGRGIIHLSRHPSYWTRQSALQDFQSHCSVAYLSDQNATEVVHCTFGNNSDSYRISSEVNGSSQSMQNAFVDIVHNLGKLFMTHASDLNAWTQAAISGTNGIQHIPTSGCINASNILTIRESSTTWSTPTMNIARSCSRNTILAGTDSVGTLNANTSVPWGQSLHFELENLVDAGLTSLEALRFHIPS